MKKQYLLLIVLLIFSICLGFFLYGKAYFNKPSNEVWIGLNNTNKTRSVMEIKRFEVDSQSTIDKIELIFLNSEKLEQPKSDLGEFDVQLSFKSNKKNTSDYNFLIWFTNEGAIIKTNGINIKKYRGLDKVNANSLKELIKYNKN